MHADAAVFVYHSAACRCPSVSLAGLVFGFFGERKGGGWSACLSSGGFFFLLTFFLFFFLACFLSFFLSAFLPFFFLLLGCLLSFYLLFFHYLLVSFFLFRCSVFLIFPPSYALPSPFVCAPFFQASTLSSLLCTRPSLPPFFLSFFLSVSGGPWLVEKEVKRCVFLSLSGPSVHGAFVQGGAVTVFHLFHLLCLFRFVRWLIGLVSRLCMPLSPLFSPSLSVSCTQKSGSSCAHSLSLCLCVWMCMKGSYLCKMIRPSLHQSIHRASGWMTQ
mmetsp:Transcript_12259/g.23747  ORF Transcript_12259/g.23747 Transcript_12259/m.23747 type:complete len:273 (+) Transcript_12259:676-1494(+)